MTDIIDFDVRTTAIEGLVVVTMKQITDERGTVREFFRASAFEAAGINGVGFSQLNVTESRRGAVRGMHGEDMNKLVAVAAGSAFGAYVDLRDGSASFGAVETVELAPGTQVFVPGGVANGFQALEDPTQYVYCFNREWQPAMPGRSCSPLDPDLAIPWPLPIDVDNRGQVSAKDLSSPAFNDIVSEVSP